MPQEIGAPAMPRGRKRKDRLRGRVTGIGGIFFKSNNPERLYRWYEQNLGLLREPYGAVAFRWRELDRPHSKGLTVWAIFSHRTRYFSPSRSRFMVNYRVHHLDQLLTRLRRRRVWVDPRRETTEYGRFAWIRDRDGNRIELWEPPRG